MLNRARFRSRPVQPTTPPPVLLLPCECSYYRGATCITCRRWQLVFDQIAARRALWANLPGGSTG